ncbi:hypothetical protein [Arsenicicoccus bolidensis]|uniref:hypothetical protein n=1 Tax=Arsenicicoccus bolidensis TaxID=229480 RepID=UPI00146A4E3A|nr:hypothetical protein [Arsenicicoccus bolidensis]
MVTTGGDAPQRHEGDAVRLRLQGDRFDGGRLPASALVEIQRYAELVRDATIFEWREQHPGQEVPEELNAALDLALVDIQNGSALAVLDYGTESYHPQIESGESEVLKAISARANNITAAASDLIELPPWTQHENFYHFGASLDVHDSLTIEANHHQSVVVDANFADRSWTSRSNSDAGEQEEDIPKSSQEAGSITGRLTLLSPEKKTYELVTIDGLELRGRYKDDELSAALKGALGTSTSAPLMRVHGTLSVREGHPWRVWATETVEVLMAANEPWQPRLQELAQMPPGWGDGPENKEIAFSALDAAHNLLLAAKGEEIGRPGVFPVEDGGVTLEWANASNFTSIEVTPDAIFNFTDISAGDSTVFTHQTAALDEALKIMINLQSRQIITEGPTE